MAITVANAVLHPVTGAAQTFHELINDPATKENWIQSNTNEVARLSQGFKTLKIKSTNTIFFIPRSAFPEGRKPTYLNIVVDYRPQKFDPYRFQWTVGGNLIDYPSNASTPTADMPTCRHADMPTCQHANMPTCRHADKNFFNDQRPLYSRRLIRLF